ncbi:GATA transcription factor 26-like [Andrographis paniculata]|uniref:GATA transcription factor 26-like n=1 Tax=Andrographis paniculata TaxID=175694 RepID=UPI0021E80ECC|nr:GATA transcription factor 26-like [Andrographis paniculata]
MGKQGPCHHCGVTSTPLWRNGPPEKPVLCNACGSRWRTKGTLANYTPLHARAEPQEFEDYRVSKLKVVPMKNKEAKVLKRRYDNDAHATEFGGVLPDFNQGFRKGLEEDTSNRSSSGSAVSHSESCAQYGGGGGGGGDASELTGPSQPVVWDTVVPSRKRTCVTRPKPSPVEKLTKDLYTIWHEQQSSCVSASSEEELLLESDKPMVSVEIGHGSVLIRHPSSIAREEESEASSLSIDNKHRTLNPKQLAFAGLVKDAGANFSSKGVDKIKKPVNLGPEQPKSARDKDQADNVHVMTYHKSPLCYIDLQDIVNIDKFTTHLTQEEQQQLLKFLPSVDTSVSTERDSSLVSRLGSMFDSPHLKENLASFQKLLADGLFDNSLSGLKAEDRRALKKAVLCNSIKSKWVEHYKDLKDSAGKRTAKKSELAAKSKPLVTESSASVKRSHDGLHQRISGAKVGNVMKSPRRISMLSGYDQKENSFFGGKGLFSSHYDDGSSQVLDSSHFVDDNSEQDLLLNVPSYGSFPQAELLPNSSLAAQASASSSSVYPNFGHP